MFEFVHELHCRIYHGEIREDKFYRAREDKRNIVRLVRKYEIYSFRQSACGWNKTKLYVSSGVGQKRHKLYKWEIYQRKKETFKKVKDIQHFYWQKLKTLRTNACFKIRLAGRAVTIINQAISRMFHFYLWDACRPRRDAARSQPRDQQRHAQ